MLTFLLDNLCRSDSQCLRFNFFLLIVSVFVLRRWGLAISFLWVTCAFNQALSTQSHDWRAISPCWMASPQRVQLIQQLCLFIWDVCVLDSVTLDFFVLFILVLTDRSWCLRLSVALGGANEVVRDYTVLRFLSARDNWNRNLCCGINGQWELAKSPRQLGLQQHCVSVSR